MTTTEYINNSSQFENRADDMIQRLAENFDVAHAAQGIGDEFLEFMMALEELYNMEQDQLGLFEEQVTKEAGDIMWYVAILCRKYGYNLDNNAIVSDKIPVMSLMYSIQKLLGDLKKHVFYGKELNHNDMQFCINNIVRNLTSICNKPIEEIIERNYNKLYARYSGQQFSSEAAINKDESKE